MTVAAVLLAAGRATRFSGGGKLMADISGTPLIAHVAKRVVESRARPIVVVVRPDDGGIQTALQGLEITFAINADPEERMGRSIAVGISALGNGPHGAMILPGDMPGLTVEIIDRLIAAFEHAGQSRIVYPALPDGSQRNPVVWPRRFFARLTSLQGAGGAKTLLKEVEGEAVAVPFPVAEPFQDIDTQEDLAAYLQQRSHEKA